MIIGPHQRCVRLYMAMYAYLGLGKMAPVVFARGVADVQQRGVETGEVVLRHRKREPQRFARERCSPASGVPRRDRGVLIADDHLRTRDAGPAEREGNEREDKQHCRRGNHSKVEEKKIRRNRKKRGGERKGRMRREGGKVVEKGKEKRKGTAGANSGPCI